MPLYRHTQIGFMVIIPLIIMIGVIVALPLPNVPVLFFPLMILGIVILSSLFATLTVEVTNVHLKFWFGIGLIHKRILLSDSASCNPAHTVLPGYGIHGTRRGWLYNVSGFKLVEITLKNGKRIFLGTDEPEDLCRAITKAIQTSAKLTADEDQNILHHVQTMAKE